MGQKTHIYLEHENGGKIAHIILERFPCEF